MKKLVFIFAAIIALGLASCDTKPAGQGDTQDTTVQAETVGVDTNQVETPEVTPTEATKDAPEATDVAVTEVPQE